MNKTVNKASGVSVLSRLILYANHSVVVSGIKETLIKSLARFFTEKNQMKQVFLPYKTRFFNVFIRLKGK